MAPSPDKHYQARILDRRDISSDLWIIRIDPGGPFEFRAGQYATLGVEQEGKRIERAYSIVSSPYEEWLEFFVVLVPLGGLTPPLFQTKQKEYAAFPKKRQGALHAGFAQREKAPLTGIHGDLDRSVCELRANALSRLEKWRQHHAREPQAVLPAGREPFVGVRLSRRTRTLFERSAVAQVCGHGEPAVGGFELER